MVGRRPMRVRLQAIRRVSSKSDATERARTSAPAGTSDGSEHRVRAGGERGLVRQGVINRKRGSGVSELRDLSSCIVQWVVDSEKAQTNT